MVYVYITHEDKPRRFRPGGVFISEGLAFLEKLQGEAIRVWCLICFLQDNRE